MDPGGMMNEGGPYNLAEIWQFPTMNGGAPGDSVMRGGVPFGGPNLAQLFADSNLNGSTCSDPTSLNHAPPQVTVAGPSGARKRREAAQDEAAKVVSTSNGDGANDVDSKRHKTSGCGEEGCDGRAEAESGGKGADRKKQPPEPPKDYIHVRARRGQATDSHSLAERARREKISERMKILQDLVPGCNKVIGKALVLDEIINYIQSLQRQVEFLSMKLETVNSRMNPAIEVFPPKEFAQQQFENLGVQFGSQPATREDSRGASPEWLHMQVGGGFERTS